MFHVKHGISMESTMVDPPVAVRTICRKNGQVVTDEQLASLGEYVRRLLEWNRTINLISRRDEENVWFSHVLHSLSILFYVKIPSGLRILDLGSGGGLPGIPLAIARPDLSVALLDSIKKKTMVTSDIAGALRLENVKVINGRAEELAVSEPRSFDMVVARAVAPLEDLCKWSRPLVGTGDGKQPHLLALKGGDLEKEIERVRGRSGIAITVINMAFEGSLEIGLEEKKLVLVHFT